MDRRDFLLRVTSATAAGWLGVSTSRAQNQSPTANAPRDDKAPKIWTVRGPIGLEEVGLCLPHEHILVDFIGADQVSRDRYDEKEVTQVVVPHLQRAKELGARTLVECTPAYLGRNPKLLATFSELTGLHIVTNTGYYAANGGKHLPAHARTETDQQLAARWIKEWKDGIEDTGIKPGFIKIAVGAGPLIEVERKLVRAAAKTHRETGLTIASHTGGGRAALEQLDILAEEGVAANAFIWVHAQTERDSGKHTEAAARGAFVEFDGLTSEPAAIQLHVRVVSYLRRRGHFQRVLISHDGGWFHVGEPDGGEFRTYEPLFNDFLPALRAEGYEDEDIQILTSNNPVDAFSVRKRLR